MQEGTVNKQHFIVNKQHSSVYGKIVRLKKYAFVLKEWRLFVDLAISSVYPKAASID